MDNEGFHVDTVHLQKIGTEIKHIKVEIALRKNSQAICRHYNKEYPTYDTDRKHRHFEFVLL